MEGKIIFSTFKFYRIYYRSFVINVFYIKLMKKQYYCEMESPIYRQIIAEKLKIEGKEIKGNKKGKRKNVII
jgi:hypothetical protein